MLDTIVDNYFLVIERLGLQVEDIEDEVIEYSQPVTQERIDTLKAGGH